MNYFMNYFIMQEFIYKNLLKYLLFIKFYLLKLNKK